MCAEEPLRACIDINCRPPDLVRIFDDTAFARIQRERKYINNSHNVDYSGLNKSGEATDLRLFPSQQQHRDLTAVLWPEVKRCTVFQKNHPRNFRPKSLNKDCQILIFGRNLA